MAEKKIWHCKIGEVDTDLVPIGGDNPMRIAIKKAYKNITGRECEFCFSGWGAELTKSERESTKLKK